MAKRSHNYDVNEVYEYGDYGEDDNAFFDEEEE